jgi:hypothetical protein
VVEERGTSPSPSQHGLAAALAARREHAVSLWERAKHTWPVEWWTELQALGFVRSCFQFAGIFVLSFLPFLLVVSAVLNRNLPQALVTRSSFSQQAAQDVTSLFARSGTGAVSQSIIGVIFVLAGGDSVASTLQDWYGKVFGEDIPPGAGPAAGFGGWAVSLGSSPCSS